NSEDAKADDPRSSYNTSMINRWFNINLRTKQFDCASILILDKNSYKMAGRELKK
ncbi:hypothetical protein TNIN_78841, partial [Trichonephila inaurata madagascariensis]